MAGVLLIVVAAVAPVVVALSQFTASAETAVATVASSSVHTAESSVPSFASSMWVSASVWSALALVTLVLMTLAVRRARRA